MKRRARVLIVIGTTMLSQMAFAQQTKTKFSKQVDASIHEFSNTTGIVVTEAVRRKIVSRGPTRYRHGGRVFRHRYYTRRHRWAHKGGGWVIRWFTAPIVSVLKTYPVISLVVKPVPPKDYIVQINGKPYPATDQSQYAVARGHVEVKVERPGAKLCEWDKDIEKNEIVTCDFSESDGTPQND